MGTWEHVRDLRLTTSVQASDGASPVLHAVRLRRLRPVPRPEDPRARVGWRRMATGSTAWTPCTRTPRWANASRWPIRRRTTSAPAAGSPAIPTSARSTFRGTIRCRAFHVSHFPHADHTPEYVHDLDELASMFPAGASRRRFLGDNCRALFGLPATAGVVSELIDRERPEAGRQTRMAERRTTDRQQPRPLRWQP